MARPSGGSLGGARPHLMIMDEMSYTYNEYGDRVPATDSLPLPKPTSKQLWEGTVPAADREITDEYGNYLGTKPVEKTVEPFNPEDERLTRQAWEHLAQSPRDEQRDTPSLVVRQANISTGATVMVMWGEARFAVGVVTGKTPGGYFVKMLEESRFSGGYVHEALGVVLSEPPQFDTAEEAEDWLMRSGEQEWFPGDVVRVSERREREAGIQHGRIVKYLGIQGKEPPKYLIDIHGEPRITASYFIKGRA